MEKALFTIGVDVSKNTLDVYCIEVRQHIRILNNSAPSRVRCTSP